MAVRCNPHSGTKLVGIGPDQLEPLTAGVEHRETRGVTALKVVAVIECDPAVERLLAVRGGRDGQANGDGGNGNE